jgi:hypothetical protein
VGGDSGADLEVEAGEAVGVGEMWSCGGSLYDWSCEEGAAGTGPSLETDTETWHSIA